MPAIHAQNQASRTARIRQLNDTLRQFFVGGRVLITPAVDALPMAAKALLLDRIQRFTDFNSDNDPHGEHDFVTVEINGQTYFAKIDYYTPDMQGGSEDPADPDVTTRVLTIMRADEY